MSNANPPATTGNPALDSALAEIRRIETDFDARAAEIKAAGGAVDERLKKIESDTARATADVRAIAERLAKFDAPTKLDAIEKRAFSVGRLACALFAETNARNAQEVTDAWKDAGFEREVIAQTRTDNARAVAEMQRIMGTTNDETGGVLIPSAAIGDWIELLRSKLVLPKLGARVLPNLVGHRIPVPGLSSGASAAWYGEGEEPTASDIKFKARYLEPHRVASFVAVHNNLLAWSPWAVESIITEDMTAALATKIEDGLLFGQGTEDSPLGIVRDPDVNTVEIGADANNGARFSVRHVPDFEFKLEEDNLDVGDDAGFVFHPSVKRYLKKEGVANYSGQSVDAGTPYMVPGISDAALQTLLGYKFASTTAVPTDLVKGTDTNLTYVLFGLWRQMLLGQWGGIRLRMSKESGNSSLGSAFLKDQTWIVAETLVDGIMRRPDALVVCSDAEKTV